MVNSTENADQPRDEHGRFSGGGSIGLPGGKTVLGGADMGKDFSKEDHHSMMLHHASQLGKAQSKGDKAGEKHHTEQMLHHMKMSQAGSPKPSYDNKGLYGSEGDLSNPHPQGHDWGTNNARQTMRQSFWQWFGSMMTGNAQPRHPITGTYQGKAANAAKRGHNGIKSEFEPASAELHEDDAAAELVGRQTTHDGRNVDKLTEEEMDDLESDPRKADIDLESVEDETGDFDPSKHERTPMQLFNWGQQDKTPKPPKAVASGSNEAIRRQQAAADQHGGMTSTNPRPTGNANPEGHNQYSGGALGKKATQATQKAEEASTRAEKENTPEAHEAAAEAHGEAGYAHRKLHQKITPDIQPDSKGVHHLPSSLSGEKSDEHYRKSVEHSHKASKLKPTGNCSSDMVAKNQYGTASVADHEAIASHDAAAASMKHPEHRKPALEAMDHASEGKSDKAAAAHLQAAKMHEKSAVEAHKDKEPMDAETHMHAAGLHRKAAAMHQAVRNATENAWSDAARKAAAEARAATSKTGKNLQHASRAHAASEESDTHSERQAADAHQAAAQHHATASKMERRQGDDEAADAHMGASVAHSKALQELMKRPTGNQGEPAMLTREQMLSKLTANCSCEGDKAAFNAMSDGTLASLVSNKFPPNFKKKGKEEDDEEEGEMADNDKEMHSFDDGPVSAGSQQAGSKGTKEEYSKTDAGVKNQQQREIDAWLKNAPAPVANAVRLAMEHEKQVKLGICRRLVANIGDQTMRNRIGNKLMRESLPELQERLLMAGPQVQNRGGYEEEALPNYFGAQTSPEVTTNAADQDEPLVPPTLNFQEMSGLKPSDFERRRA